MKSIAVHIKEIDKKGRDLTLINLRDEIVGYLYRDTVARATKSDMQFYLLFFFASIEVSGKTSIEQVLDEALPKFEGLNEAFENRRGYLRANEYAEMVEKHGLNDYFYKDLFFVICDIVQNINAIEKKFNAQIEADENLQNVILRLKRDYKARVEADFEVFASSRIEDDRVDENGNYHDLSKSVYRTVRMRSARNLELNLQKYTAIKKIESNSPIDLTLIQHVDPNIIFELWDKYHVAKYVTTLFLGTWHVVNEPFPAAALTMLIGSYINHRTTNGRRNRKEKDLAKAELDDQKINNDEYLQSLNERLVESVLESNAKLREEVDKLKEERLFEAQKYSANRDEQQIKDINQRIEQLENLKIETTEVQDEGPQSKLL